MKLNNLIRLALIGAAFLASMQVFAADTPAALDGTTLVNADKVKQMLESGTPVIDTRVANEFADSHVKGAKSVPYKEKSAKAADYNPAEDSFDLSKLPSDKSAPVVFYCNSGECWKSYKASKAALAAGYRKIHWFRGGFPEWKSKGYPVE